VLGRSGAIRAGRAFVELFADDSPLVRDLRRAEKKLKSFAGNVRAMGQKLLGSALTLAIPVTLSLATFAGFQDQMAEVRAVTQAATGDFKQLYDQAKELGRTTSFTAGEVAGGQAELGRAGFKPDEILQATAAVLDLSRATKTDLPQASQIAADSLRSFRLEAAQMPRVADVLTSTANNSSQGLTDLFEALKTVAPVAADLGASIEDTAAAIGVLANNGIKGTLAGNALKRAYLNLTNPGIRKKLEQLTGVSAVDASGNLRPLATVIAEIGEATKRLPNAQRVSIFAELFGDRAVVAASNLATANANFRDLQNTLNDSQGAAARTAKIMDDTFGGSLRRLWSAVEGVSISLGETLAPAARRIADQAGRVALSVSNWINENKELVQQIAALVAIGAIVGTILIGLGIAAGAAAFAFSGVATVISTIGFLLTGFGPLVAAAAGLIAGGIGGAWQNVSSTATRAWDAIVDRIMQGDLAGAAQVAMSAIQSLWTQLTSQLLAHWAPVLVGFRNGWTQTVTFLTDVFGPAVDWLKDTFGSLLDWWNSSDGIESVSFTFADVVSAIATMWSRMVAEIQTLAGETSDFIADALDMGKANVGAISEDERDRRIFRREQARNRRNTDIESDLQSTLAEIEADRERKRAAEQADVRTLREQADAEAETSRLEFQATLDAVMQPVTEQTREPDLQGLFADAERRGLVGELKPQTQQAQKFEAISTSLDATMQRISPASGPAWQVDVQQALQGYGSSPEKLEELLSENNALLRRVATNTEGGVI
jgi:TP901 family phage tail tape measure protein